MWKESLTFFQMENLTPFLLVTAKSIVEAYKNINLTLSKKGKGLLLIGIVIALIFLNNALKYLGLFPLISIILNGIKYFLIILFTLELRPSVDRKDWAYYSEYISKYRYMLSVIVLLGVLGFDCAPILRIWFLLLLLAGFDSGATLEGFKRAFRISFYMLLYNLPVVIAAYIVVALVNIALFYLIGFSLSYFGGLTLAAFMYLIFIPIEVALVTNLYIKFLHTKPSLYFEQPE